MNDYAYNQRRSEVIRKAHEQEIELSAEDFGRDGDHPTLDGMDATEWFEAMTEIDWITGQPIPES